MFSQFLTGTVSVISCSDDASSHSQGFLIQWLISPSAFKCCEKGAFYICTFKRWFSPTWLTNRTIRIKDQVLQYMTQGHNVGFLPMWFELAIFQGLKQNHYRVTAETHQHQCMCNVFHGIEQSLHQNPPNSAFRPCCAVKHWLTF